MSAGRGRLPSTAEALLTDFPTVAVDFEAQARAIETRLERADFGEASEVDLLAAPKLEPEAGEPPHPSSIRATAPRTSLVELARRSLQPAEDEEAAALTRQLLSGQNRSRRPDADLTRRVQAARTTSAVPARAPVIPSSDITLRSSPNPAQASKGRPIWLGVAAAVALAAGLAVVTRPGPSTEVSISPSPLNAVQAQAPAAKPGSPSLGEANPLPPLAKPGALSRAETTASAPPAEGATEAPPSAAVRASGAGPAKARAADPKRAALAAPSASAPAAASPPRAESEPLLQPAEGRPGIELPEKPSQGAVSSALGQVMGKARSCLAGQGSTVSAAVTFGSNGGVENVTANGPAASCIRSALARARVQPFARDSFRTDIVVRPP